MKWINKPRRIIIRDIIMMSLNQSAKRLEDIAGKHQLMYEKPLQLCDLQRYAAYLEKRGVIKHCPLTNIFARTDIPYKFSYQP